MPINRNNPNRDFESVLQANLNGTTIVFWKTFKGLTYTLLFATFGAYAVANGADPEPILFAVLIASTAAMVGELKELQIANFATLTFRNNHDDDADGDGE